MATSVCLSAREASCLAAACVDGRPGLRLGEEICTGLRDSSDSSVKTNQTGAFVVVVGTSQLKMSVFLFKFTLYTEGTNEDHSSPQKLKNKIECNANVVLPGHSRWKLFVLWRLATQTHLSINLYISTALRHKAMASVCVHRYSISTQRFVTLKIIRGEPFFLWMIQNNCLSLQQSSERMYCDNGRCSFSFCPFLLLFWQRYLSVGLFSHDSFAFHATWWWHSINNFVLSVERLLQESVNAFNAQAIFFSALFSWFVSSQPGDE